MATVYVVTQGTYSDYHIKGVFSTEELAREYFGDDCTIEEYELDVELKTAKRETAYDVHIRLSDGALLKCQPVGVCEEIDSMRETQIYMPLFRRDNKIEVRSFVSQEHAVKVAIEKRQEWLRTHPS